MGHAVHPSVIIIRQGGLFHVQIFIFHRPIVMSRQFRLFHARPDASGTAVDFRSPVFRLDFLHPALLQPETPYPSETYRRVNHHNDQDQTIKLLLIVTATSNSSLTREDTFSDIIKKHPSGCSWVISIRIWFSLPYRRPYHETLWWSPESRFLIPLCCNCGPTPSKVDCIPLQYTWPKFLWSTDLLSKSNSTMRKSNPGWHSQHGLI